MQYFISFLEGIITFISPCLLPMLPIYLSYFAGGGQCSAGKTLKNAFGFVVGFSLVFMAMGALAGTLGSLLRQYQTAVNVLCGLVIILFGLNYMGLLKLKLFAGMKGSIKEGELGFVSSALFGVIFSIGWTPCVGTFLGTALMMASTRGQIHTGILMLLAYSLGLGIPFLISALLIDRLKNAFQFIKKNYPTINFVCGLFLILTGILMATGLLGKFLTLLS